LTDPLCPQCGARLPRFVAPAYCEHCGLRIEPSQPGVHEASTSFHRRAWLPLGGAEVVGLIVFFIASVNDAPFPIPAVLGAAAIAATLILVGVAKREVSPAAKLAKEEGLVGLGKAFYERVGKPILYGKRGARK
jgi:hypothetical protein